jgi:hypothetical protein
MLLLFVEAGLMRETAHLLQSELALELPASRFESVKTDSPLTSA